MQLIRLSSGSTLDKEIDPSPHDCQQWFGLATAKGSMRTESLSEKFASRHSDKEIFWFKVFFAQLSRVLITYTSVNGTEQRNADKTNKPDHFAVLLPHLPSKESTERFAENSPSFILSGDFYQLLSYHSVVRNTKTKLISRDTSWVHMRLFEMVLFLFWLHHFEGLTVVLTVIDNISEYFRC